MSCERADHLEKIWVRIEAKEYPQLFKIKFGDEIYNLSESANTA